MIRISAVAQAPLTLPVTRERGLRTRTLPYVPGTAVRGALAAAWINENGAPRRGTSGWDEFVELFEGEVRYGPLLPQGTTFEPLSVLRCRDERSAACRTPVDLAELDSPAAAPTACPSCGGPMESGKGRLLGVDLEEITRVSLTEDETARDGHLFTTEVLPAGTELAGVIHGDHSWLLDRDGTRISLGRRRSVAGRTSLSCATVEPTVPTARPDGRIVIRLVSPAIIVDRWGAPSSTFDLVEVADHLGVERDAIADAHAWCRVERAGGWHAVSGLPKPDEVLLSPGSTLVIAPSRPVGHEQLIALTSASLGLRTNEGFGMVEVNPAPWEPPVPIEPPSASTGHEGDPLRDQLPRALTRPERRWLIGLLRERRAHPALEVRAPARRLLDMAPTTRELVEQALTLDADAISGVIESLLDEGLGQRA